MRSLICYIHVARTPSGKLYRAPSENENGRLLRPGKLYFGDNLEVLRGGDFRDNTIHLVPQRNDLFAWKGPYG